MSRSVRLWVGALVALGLCGVGCAVTPSGTEGPARLPEIELPGLDEGEPLRLAEIDGVSVINLWATWCAPCRRELPDFEQVHLEMIGEVRFIGVNLGDRAADAAAFIAEVGVSFEQYLDADGSLNERLGTATLPVTVITDPQGRISLVHSGPMDAAELKEAIAAAEG